MPWVNRVTRHSFTASSFKTSSPSATGSMLGVTMLHPPLTPAFLFLFSHLPSLSNSLSVCMSPSFSLLLSSGGHCRAGQCIGGDYVRSADSDLTFSELYLRPKATPLDLCPCVFPLCSCSIFAVDLAHRIETLKLLIV